MLELYRNQVDIQLINAKLDERSKGLNLGRFVDLAIVLQSIKIVFLYNYIMPVMKTNQAVCE